jgi:primosomal replication protein N
VEYNTITLSGIILEVSEARVTPAGIPHRRFLLEHRSRQVEANHPREVLCRMPVELRGEVAQSAKALLTVGERVVVTGFVDRFGYKDEAASRFVLHAKTVKSSSPEAL